VPQAEGLVDVLVRDVTQVLHGVAGASTPNLERVRRGVQLDDLPPRDRAKNLHAVDADDNRGPLVSVVMRSA
jgi:hypothetical protein